jgi:iron(III) transport system permease protein
MIGVGVSVFLTGVTSAYLVSAFSFPGQKLFEWLLLLPLAVPAYVIAYLYTDLLEFAGPVKSAFRAVFGWELARDYWFPNIRSMGGAIMVMGLVLYPYVYLLARVSFLEQSPHLTDVSRLMGRSRFKTFLFVSLPIARPAVAIGIALALMETLNDFGTVDFFAIQMTAGLFDVWLNMNNLGGAAQIAVTMLTFVLLLLGLEHAGRKRTGFYQSSGRFSNREKTMLDGWRKWAAFMLCLLPVLAGFIIPMLMLLDYSIDYFEESWTPQFRQYALNSLSVSFSAAVACIVIAIVVSFSRRLENSKWLGAAARIASMGYAVPGAVLAVGIVIPLAAFDNAFDGFMRTHFDLSTGLLLSGSTFALVLAYVIRFLAISIGSIESSFSKVSISIDYAARTLGNPPFRTLRLFHLPLIKGGILTAALIVFVDCMKELPATLLLRPFNFETLATNVYLYASDEMIERSALGALLIVLSGLIPVVVLSKTISYSHVLENQPE